jgi:hypothetical protein
MLLRKVKDRLKELNIPYESVMLSPRPDKKIRIVINNKIIDFGAKNSITYIEGATEEKRKSYIARHSKILLKDGSRAIDKKYSPAYLSFYVLW